MVISCRLREVGTSEDLAYMPYRFDPAGENHDGCGMPLVRTQRLFAQLSRLPLRIGPNAVLIAAMAACGFTTVMETAPSGRCVSALALPLASCDIAGMRTSRCSCRITRTLAPVVGRRSVAHSLPRRSRRTPSRHESRCAPTPGSS